MVFARAAVLSAALLAAFTQAAPLDVLDREVLERDFTYSNLTSRGVSSSLSKCLAATSVELSYPGESDFSTLEIQQNAALPTRTPGVFALPKHPAGVAKVVKCVAAEGGSQKISPRSGGHSYTGYDLGGGAGWVVVDLKHINSISVDSAAKTATVGGGSKLGPMAKTLAAQGFALPHGTCPSVGVGGHSLGGGYGFASFGWGFLLDHIVSMQLVKADGSIVTVSSSQNPDLFYALRGAGSNNFGIVTSFTYALEDAPTHIVNFSHKFKSNADCVQAILAAQDITATKGSGGWPAQFGAELLLTGDGTGQDYACDLTGQFLGDKAAFKAAMKKFNDKVGAAGVEASSVSATDYTSWADALTGIMGSLDASTYTPESYYAKSLVTPSSVRYDAASARKIMDALNAAAAYGPSISLDLLGPNSYSNSVPASASAFVHRDALWVSQYYSYNFPKNNNGGAQDKVYKAFDKLVNAAKAVDPSANWGGYVNYIDAQLIDDDWGTFYYGDAVNKLKSIKKANDPKNIFDFPMAISRA